MALLGNYSILHKSPAKYMSGQTGSGDRANCNKPGSMRDRGVGGTSDWSRVAVPTGFYSGGAWLLPQTAGDMTSRREATGYGAVNAGNLAGGLYGISPLTGAGAITNANLGLIVSGVAALAGSGAFSSAAIAGKLDAIVALGRSIRQRRAFGHPLRYGRSFGGSYTVYGTIAAVAGGRRMGRN